MSTVDDLLAGFEQYIDARYSSQNTKSAYLRDAKDFLRVSDSFDLNGVEKFLHALFDRGLKPSSIVRKFASLSVFFEYLKEKGIVDKNYAKLLDKPKVKKDLPKFLDVDETIALLESVKNKRDRAILELLYSSSLRASELLGLNVEDIDFENMRLKVKRKGGSVVYVPFSERAKRFLTEYVGLRKSGPLFLNKYGKRLSDRYLRKLVKRYALRSIFKDISPHTLRHTKATHLLNSGMDIRLLQKFLGHSSIKATQIYTHVNLRQLAETYDNTHPLAKDE